MTDNPECIWSADLNDPTRLEPQQKDSLYLILVNHMKQLVQDRDTFAHHIVEMTLTTSAADQVMTSLCETPFPLSS